VLIIGQGPKWDYLQKMIKEMNLTEKVLMLGKVEHISSFLKNCDIFCLPSVSRNESFGLVLVEALYFGKPLVTTDVYGSGMSYVNEHNKTGLIVPVNNPESLARAINQILYDEALYSHMQSNALIRCKNFDIIQIADMIKHVYLEVLKC
jgi:glycosyltransferase involved in cell wall biosynthesis